MVLTIVCLLLSTSVAAEWAEWRGPTRDGVITDFNLPEDLPSELKLVWKKKVGYGYASPIANEGAVYTFTREKDDEIVRKLDLKKGKELWRKKYEAPLEMDWYGTGNHPKSTPAISGSRLVTLGITGVLTCWDAASGDVVWRKTFEDEFEQAYPKFGAAASPLILDGQVFVPCGGEKGGAFRSFSLETGEVLWSWSEDGPAYASPVLVQHGDRRDLITQSEHFLFAVDAGTGEESWRIPFETAHAQNIITSVAVADTLYYSGYKAGTHAVRLTDGEPDSLWSQSSIHQFMGSSVVVDGVLIGFDHMKKGRLFCLDASTGEILWLTHGRWGRTASIMVMKPYIVVLSVDGQLSFSKISREKYRTTAQYEVGESETWAHPAFVDGYIVTKDERHVSVWTF
jgi:outer membrane protein assembly factor BamB